MWTRMRPGLVIEALMMGLVGIAFSLLGWLVADPDVIDVIVTGDILLSLAIVGSAFVILGALSYLTREISALKELLQKQRD